MRFLVFVWMFALWSSRTATLSVEEISPRRSLVRGDTVSCPEGKSLHCGSDLKLRYRVESTVSRDDERLVRRASIFLESLVALGSNSSALVVSDINQLRAVVVVLRERADIITKCNFSLLAQYILHMIPFHSYV
jgi:hypothetical protein